jgi:DNA-binding NtrC family response regulator
MGRVYLAEDLLEDRQQVALKLYPRGTHADLLRREFLALRGLRHPSIARAFHLGASESDGAAFFTMEYVAGKPLDRYLLETPDREGTGEPQRSRLHAGLDLFLQAASACRHLHERGLVHLDLKPANMLVVEIGKAGGAAGSPGRPLLILIDFGLIRAPGSESGGPRRGTVPFMAPELFDGRTADPRTDVYALGVTFYLALTGRYPFEGGTVDEWADAHRTAAPAAAPEIPRPLERVLQRALAKDPARRFAGGSELTQALFSTRRELGRRGRPWQPAAVEPEMVGRRSEIEAFERWLQGERRTQPLLLVAGAEGMGKSRLLSEMETRLETAKMGVVWARGREEEPLLGDLVRRAALLFPRRFATHRDSVGARVLRYCADLPPRDGGTRRLVAMIGAEEARRIAVRVAVERLRALLREEPVFILIDDLDRSSAEGRELVVELGAALAASGGEKDAPEIRGGIIASARALREGLQEIRSLCEKRGARAAWLSLGPLSPADSRRLLLLAAGEGAPGTSRWFGLRRASGGNPLHLLEELRASGTGPGPRSAASGRRRRLRERLSELTGLAREVALLLAVSGRPLPLETLSRAAGASGEETAHAVRELSFAGILERGPGRGVRFLHGSMAGAAAELVPTADRAPLHRRLAVALESARRSSPSAESRFELAHHLFEAGEEDRAVALTLTLAAGEEPVARDDPRAREVLERAARARGIGERERRRMLEALGDRLDRFGRFAESLRVHSELSGLRGLEPVERARYLRKLAAACHRAGDSHRAERLLRESIRLVSAGPPPARRAEVWRERLASFAELALLYHFRQDVTRARECAARGLETFRSWSAFRARSKGDLEPAPIVQRAIDLHAIAGQIAIRALALDEAAKVLEAGLRLARSEGARLNAALLLNNLGLARHLQSRFGEALASFRGAERTAVDTGDGAALASIRSNVAQIHAKLGRFTRALGELGRLAGEPAVRQSPRMRLGLSYSEALVLGLLGDPAADWSGVRALAGRIGDGFLQGFAAVYQAESEIVRGNWSRALDALRGARGAAPGRIAEARRARIESALGRYGKSEAASLRYRRAKGVLPDLAGAWDRLQLGQALADRALFAGALRELLAAARFFRARRIRPGEIEAALLLADLELRWAALSGSGSGSHLRAAQRWIDRALSLRVEEPAGRTARFRALRGSLLAARLEMRRALRGESSARALANARDLLASAGGDPRLGELFDLSLQVEALQAALARLSGEGDAQAAMKRLEEARDRYLRRLEPADRRAHSGLDLFERLGLPELSAKRPGQGPPWAWEALRAALGALARGDGGAEDAERAAREALEAAGRRLRASALIVVAAGRGGRALVRLSWPAEAGRSTLPAELKSRRFVPPPLPLERRGKKETVLWCPLRAAGEPSAALAAIFRQKERAETAPVLDFLSLLADALSAAGTARSLPTGPRALEPPPSAKDREPATQAIATRTRTLDLFERPRAEGLIGRSAVVRELAELIRAAAYSDLTVLITGESGSGKEVVARAIHRAGPRSQGPFVFQNCAAIPAGLLEADLFGYERGAFTGADRTRSGFITRARGGTFLFDEIGDADSAIQAKVLRVIEEKAVRPVGARQSIPIDVRFLAVSQRDLDVMVSREEFRRDLFYRLAGLRIHVPPLRERIEDLKPLLEHFLRRILGEEARIAPRALSRLEAHAWPGNVRELETVARRLALSMEDQSRTVRLADVEDALATGRPPPSEGQLPVRLLRDRPYPEVQRSLELEHLRALWDRHRGDLAGLAAELGASVRSVYRRFQKLGLKPKQFRQKMGEKKDLG